MSQPPVLLEQSDGLGVLTLNRPEVINALSHEMVALIQSALNRWQRDPDVRTVLLQGVGERGFCAGGDVAALYTQVRADLESGTAAAAAFWADEYRLNATISAYPKPVVVLMDGIVMGGGTGLAAHASHRIVTPSSMVAMPEVRIGLSPDVGGTYLLARAPGEVGTHLALTGSAMNGADALYCGFADVMITAEHRADLVAALRHTDADTAVARFAAPAPSSELAAARGWLDRCYSSDSVETIVQRLRACPEGLPAAAVLAGVSPTALKVSLRALRSARGDSALAQSLLREFRVSVHCLAGHDFLEGIRAQVIDKDRSPRWVPASLAEVSIADVDRYFLPVSAEEPDFTAEEQDSDEPDSEEPDWPRSRTDRPAP